MQRSLLGILSLGLVGLASVLGPQLPFASTVGYTRTVETKAPEQVKPLDLVREPASYLEKVVKFEGEFRGFSSLGLDYKPAFRDSKDYVTLLIRRPDVEHHTIPLSELKLFYKREDTEKLATLEPGDKVRFQGKVFSAALGDPWVELEAFTITKPVKREEKDENEAEEASVSD